MLEVHFQRWRVSVSRNLQSRRFEKAIAVGYLDISAIVSENPPQII